MTPRVVIGWPDGGSTSAAFTKSLLDLVRFEALEPSDEYRLVDAFHSTGLYVQHNRNELVKHAMSLGADWLLQLDTDLAFPQTLLRMIFRHADPVTRPIIAGLYANVGNYTEASFEVVNCVYGEQTDGSYKVMLPPKTLQPFQVDAAGTGIMLTHLSIFQRIDWPWFWLELISLTGSAEAQLMNEDIAFCRRAREAGYPIWCDPLAEAVHWKSLPLSPSTLRQFLENARQVRAAMDE